MSYSTSIFTVCNAYWVYLTEFPEKNKSFRIFSSSFFDFVKQKWAFVTIFRKHLTRAHKAANLVTEVFFVSTHIENSTRIKSL